MVHQSALPYAHLCCSNIANVADITAACHPEGTAPQQWLHLGRRINIICITGTVALHRLCTTEHPVWTAHGQEPIQTSGEGLCS